MNSKIKKLGGKFLVKVGLKEKNFDPPSSDINTSFVYHAFLENITEISISKKEKSQFLPNSLIIKKGNYQFGNKNYELVDEGLYRFVFPTKVNQQRIVFEENIDALLSSICWIFTHGNSDDKKSYTEIEQKALQSKIFATCGPLVSWANDFLQKLNINTRIVSTLTIDPWNSYDNGHILIEIFRKNLNKWIVYDLDNSCYFMNNKSPLSLLEFVDKVKSDEYEIKKLSNKISTDISNFKDEKNKYDYAFTIEGRLANEKQLKKWYKHVIQVPLILDKRFSYFCDIKNKDRIQKYSKYNKYMNKNDFLKKFYEEI